MDNAMIMMISINKRSSKNKLLLSLLVKLLSKPPSPLTFLLNNTQTAETVTTTANLNISIRSHNNDNKNKNVKANQINAINTFSCVLIQREHEANSLPGANTHTSRPGKKLMRFPHRRVLSRHRTKRRPLTRCLHS